MLTRGLPRAQIAALEYFGGFRPDAVSPLDKRRCDYLLVMETRQRQQREWPGWVYVATARRPTDREEATSIFRRVQGADGKK